MPDKKISIKDKLKQGQLVFGIWCVIPSASAISIVASAGFDFIIIDLEHGCASFETAEEMVRVAQSEGVSSIIRLGQVNEDYILKSLDIGADGIIVAHVSSRSESAEVVSFAKYYPQGVRGYSPYTRAGNYFSNTISDFAKEQNEKTLVGVIVEGTNGINNIEEIISTPNIDLIYIGAYDISQALGMPGKVNEKKVKDVIQRCITKAQSAGIASGGYVAKNQEDIKWMVDAGMQFITYLPDCAIFRKVCLQAVKEFVTVTKHVK